MTMINRRTNPAANFFLLLAFAAPLLGDPSTGGSYSLDGGPVSGGGVSDGATFSVDGSEGQASTDASTGGTFVVAGGLVGVRAEVEPDKVALEFTDAAGQVTLTWPATATGYVLESTPIIGDGADWQPVVPAPPGPSFTVTLDRPLRFFRLHQR